MDNPYQSPETGGGVPFGATGLAHHVPVVAILLMIQGGLETAVSLFLFLIGGLLPGVMAGAGPAANPQAPPLPMQFAVMPWIMGGFYVLLGAVVAAGGLLKIAAGWSNYRFRGRVLGFFGLASMVTALCTCYCIPTAAALFVYGLIVYCNGQTAWAFSMGKQGLSADQIFVRLANP